MKTKITAPLVILVFCFCVFLVGCETAKEKLEKADMWVHENLW